MREPTFVVDNTAGKAQVGAAGSATPRRRVIEQILLAAASGLMLGLAFAVPQLALLAWIALVPLFIAVRRCGAVAAAGLGVVTGTIFFGIYLYWSAIFGAIAIVGLVGYMAVTVGVFAAVAGWFARRLPLGWRLASIPAAWVVVEAVRSSGSWGFPWGVLGYSQQPILPIAQFVSLTGVFGLSAALALVNAGLAEVALARWEERARAMIAAAAVLATVAGVLGWGLWRASIPVTPARLRIAGVQPSIDQWAKFDAAQAESIVRILSRLTTTALRKQPAIVIWPETAIPFADAADSLFMRSARSRVAGVGADFIFGAFERTRAGGVTNSVLLATTLGRITRYDKIHLVPFGEYVPLRRLIGNIGLLRMVKVDLTAGRRPVLLESSWGPIGTVVCFESSDAPLVRNLVNLGAKLIVVVTNDGWFERTAASAQHFRITAMRAIENGTYVVQVSNNGVSGIIDPRGRVLVRTRLWDRTVMTGRVGLGAEPTPYRQLGDVVVWLAVAVLVAAGFAAARSPSPGQGS